MYINCSLILQKRLLLKLWSFVSCIKQLKCKIERVLIFDDSFDDRKSRVYVQSFSKIKFSWLL